MPSKKILAQKQKVVASLSEELKQAESLVFTDYMGLSVAEDTEMRSAFRKEGVQYSVVKNSISLRAFEAIGLSGLEEILKGPTAIAYSKEDVVIAPRLVKEFGDKFRKTKVKGGILNGELVDVSVIQSLASIPALPVLHGQLVSSLLFPITSFAVTLNQIAEKAAEAGVDQVSALVADAGDDTPAEAETKEAAADAPSEAKTADEPSEAEAAPADAADPEAAPEAAEHTLPANEAETVEE